MNPIRSAALVAAAALALALPLAAREKSSCLPTLQQGWIRLPPGGMPMHAGFARIDNSCSLPAAIVSVSSPGYGEVELHTTRNIDGVMRMRRVREVHIAPGDVVELKPGGMHLMLIEPRARVQAGSRMLLVFRLADGREFTGGFVARKAD